MYFKNIFYFKNLSVKYLTQTGNQGTRASVFESKFFLCIQESSNAREYR